MGDYFFWKKFEWCAPPPHRNEDGEGHSAVAISFPSHARDVTGLSFP